MGYVVRMPQLGMSMDEGTVVEWRAGEGEAVDEGSVVAVVESEKATHDVEARESATLRATLVSEGESVEPGTPIGVLAGPDEDLSAYEDEVGRSLEQNGDDTDTGEGAGDTDAGGGEGTGDVGRPVASTPADGQSEQTGGSDAGGGGESPDSDDAPDATVRATPGARRLAEEAGVDLAAVEGTGPQGVVTDDDVEAHVESTAAGGDDGGGGGATRTVAQSRTLSGVQRAVSERLSESYASAVHVTLNRSFDVAALESVLAAADASDDQEAAAVSVTDLLVRAAADALTAHPAFNALFEDGTHKLVEEVNVGVAVDIEDGLVTPVVPSADEKSAEAVHRTRAELTDRVQSGDFTMDDLSGGTFTVSNLGPYGVDDFTPVINPPEVAILGVGRTKDGSMTLSLSFDHRVVNGADAARFLDALVETLTDASALAAFFEVDLPVGEGFDEREVRVETAGGFGGRYRTAHGDVAFDEPEPVGGTGSAPSPVDHLLGALGSCLSLAVRSVADRDGIDVGAIETTVEGSPTRGPLESVEIELEIETDAGTDEVETLVARAERACYVSRALSEEVRIAVDWTRV